MKKMILLLGMVGLFSSVYAGSGKFKFKNETPWDIEVSYGANKGGFVGWKYKDETIKAGKTSSQHNWGLWNVKLVTLKVYCPNKLYKYFRIIELYGLNGKKLKVTGTVKIKIIKTSETQFKFQVSCSKGTKTSTFFMVRDWPGF